MFYQGRIIDMLILVLMILSTYWYIDKVKKGAEIRLRRLPALEAIDEAIGRAAETGRPVHFTPGYSLAGLYDPTMGPAIMAGLAVLKEIAKSAAYRGVRIIVTLNQSEAIPIVDEILKTAYTARNLDVPSGAVRFISTTQYAYTAGILSILREERPAANFLMGYFWSEGLQISEGGSYIGAMQIAGTSSISQLPFLIASCDYCLIGEELFAARGYIEKDAATLGTLRSQDLIREITIVYILLVWFVASLGLSSILNILKM